MSDLAAPDRGTEVPLDPATAAVRAAPTWARRTVMIAPLGVLAYVVAWFVAGIWRSDYDPWQQAISELFELDGQAGPRTLVLAGLLLSGLSLTAFGPALHRVLPGAERPGAAIAPALMTFSGLTTVAILAYPCSATCPGYGTTFTDTMHVIVAGSGYVALIGAPLLLVPRIADTAPQLASAARWLCGLALVGFVVRNASVDAFGGLQQRTFNTLADAWYVVAATWVWQRRPRPAA